MVEAPAFNACQFSKHELERCVENLRIAQVLEPWKRRADFGGDRVVSVAMPTQDLFSLLPEILEVRHGRGCGWKRRRA
jgi:hypothetical protein